MSNSEKASSIFLAIIWGIIALMGIFRHMTEKERKAVPGVVTYTKWMIFTLSYLCVTFAVLTTILAVQEIVYKISHIITDSMTLSQKILTA